MTNRTIIIIATTMFRRTIIGERRKREGEAELRKFGAN